MGLEVIDLTRAGIKERRDPNIGRHARSVGTVLVEMAPRSLVEAARVRRTRKEHPLRLQAREIL